MNDLKGKKILVTGGAGFIGSHLSAELVKRGAEVTILDNFFRGRMASFRNMELIKKIGKMEVIEGDIRDGQCVNEACKDKDYVFHEAAICIARSELYPYECVDVNIQGTTNIIRAAFKNNVKKLMFASSASVYGQPKKLPMKETDPFNPLTPYCVSKIAGELLLKTFARKGLKYVTFRYFNVYGPWQATDAYYTTVILTFIQRILSGKPPIIFGDGTQSMDFVNVKDVVQANLLPLYKEDIVNDIFNVGSGTETSLNDMIKILGKIVGKEIKPVYQKTARQSLVTRRRADVSKISKWGYKPTVKLEDGLREIVGDIKKNPEHYQSNKCN